MENPRQYGPITAMCVDKKKAWVVVGTSTGVLTLWDKRFGILLKSWQAGQVSGGRTGRIHQCVVHPTKGRGKWIIVAVEASRKGGSRTTATIMEVWDIEKTVLVESFIVRIGPPLDSPETQPTPTATADLTPASAIAALVRARQGTTEAERRSSLRSPFNDEMVPPPAPDVRAMVVGVDFGGFSTSHRSEFGEFVMEGGASSRSGSKGFVVTGSEDRKLRLWDIGRSERTTILNGLDSEHDKPSYR